MLVRIIKVRWPPVENSAFSLGDLTAYKIAPLDARWNIAITISKYSMAFVSVLPLIIMDATIDAENASIANMDDVACSVTATAITKKHTTRMYSKYCSGWVTPRVCSSDDAMVEPRPSCTVSMRRRKIQRRES